MINLGYSLSSSEEEILEALWTHQRWMTCSELVDYFDEKGKGWKRQTINTFLVRLIEKGYVTRNGRKFIYTYSKEEVETQQTIDFVESVYGGSLKKIMIALTGKENKITKKYAEELKDYLNELKENE